MYFRKKFAEIYTICTIPYQTDITNGYFSKNPDKIKSVAQNLAEYGVNEILLSVDAFHQETIPLEYVTKFAKAVLETGVEIKVQPAWLVNPDADNSYKGYSRNL